MSAARARRLVLLLAAGCGAAQGGDGAQDDAAAVGLAAIRPEALRAHVLFLADDALEGRGAGTRGHRVAAQYVATQLAALGLEPAGDRGTYFQDVPLRAMTRDDAGCSLAVDGAAVAAEHVIVYPFAARDRLEVEAPLVYGGFGIVAADQKYDDLGDVDLRGKVVVVLRGAPPAFAPATSRAVHSDFDNKAARLAERGAVAMLVVNTPEGEKVRSWAERRADAQFEAMEWMEGDRPGSGATIPSASIDMEAFATLLGPGADAGKLWDEAAAGRARARALGRTVRLRVASTFRDVTSQNVAAVLRGGDPARAGEHVVFSAHLDHLGVGAPVAGDAIYNGAIDDAIGVAGVLEIARAFAALPARPPRSILVLVVTAEEKGLLGSDYFVHHPTVPMSSIIADVNLDGPFPFYEMFDVVALGDAHSTLRRNVEEAARSMRVAVSDDPSPEQAYFIRSDQYSFVKRGVPSLFPGVGYKDATGDTTRNHAIGEAWSHAHYHQPSDEWRDGENRADWAAKEVRLDFLIGLSIARDPRRPSWNPGDIFATPR
ncbi:MAG TPA: M28 family peptidase [Kofleriaceae bacterium]|nr:M28 family peptidase [Kofleriaceae bacterium]